MFNVNIYNELYKSFQSNECKIEEIENLKAIGDYLKTK